LNADRIDPKRLTLPAELRLRRKSQFEAVYAKGRRLGDGFFSVTVGPNEVGYPRLGLAVATKTAGNSVKRNRIRRLIRESFRLSQLEIPPVDLIVSARTRAQGATSAELRASLAALWDKVRKQCASPPSS
jgi:ribonuclease P protein component